MTLTELRYIVAVARERHFGRAAASCHVAQPTLSVAIRKLEEELGVALFERGPSRVAVTATGARIVQQARRVLAEADLLCRLAEGSRDPLAAPLRIGAIHTIGPYLFPSLVARLRDTAPAMPLVIQEDFTQRLVARLQDCALDAVVAAPPFDTTGLDTAPIHEEPFRLILPVGHAWESHERIDPARLGEQPVLMVGARHCFRDQVISACPECRNIEVDEHLPADVLEGSSLETIRNMVASGMGVSVVPCTAVADDHPGRSPVAVRRFTDPEPRRRVVLAWRRSFPRPQAIEVLLQALRSCQFAGVERVERLEAPA